MGIHKTYAVMGWLIFIFLPISMVSATPLASANEFQNSFSQHLKVSLYSESLYDDRFDGGVTETRIRLIPKLKAKWFEPYAGVAFSQDLSNGDSPLLIENMVSPTLGFRARILPFLYVFSEARHLYRFQNQLRSNSESELRYGVFGYHFWSSPTRFFNETYSEIVTVDRVDTKPAAMLWNKWGKRFQPYSWLRPDVYLEGFTKYSPNLGYGPNENEVRLGMRVTLLKGFWTLSAIANYSPLSDVAPNGVDFMMVISREEF